MEHTILGIFDKLVLRWLLEADEKNDPTIRAYWKPYEIRDIKEEYGERAFITFYLLSHELYSLGKEMWLERIVRDEVFDEIMIKHFDMEFYMDAIDWCFQYTLKYFNL